MLDFDLADHPILVFALLLGCGMMAAVGVALLTIALVGFSVWVERKKRFIRRRRRQRSKLHYRDML